MDASRLTQLVLGYWPARAVSAAHELGVFELLSTGGPLPASAIADRLELRSPSLSHLLDALAGLGVLVREDDRYALSGERLVGELFAMADADAYRAWADLPHALRQGRSVFESVDDETLERFAAAMSTASAPAHGFLLGALDLTGADTVCDVGGGDGRLAVALARRHPALRCTTFDVPAVASLARRVVDDAGLADRVDVVEGDMFVDPLPHADVVILSFVLLDWSGEDRRRLLRRVAAGLPDHGRLVVLDRMGRPAGGATTFDHLRALHLLALHGDAHHYDLEELRGWLDDTGFAPPDVQELGDGIVLVVAARVSRAD